MKEKPGEQVFTFAVEVRVQHSYGPESSYDAIREDIRAAIEEMEPRDINPDGVNEYEITGVRAQ
jgi:hypothetical protein